MNFVRDLMINATNCRRIHLDVSIGAAILMLEDKNDGSLADEGGLNYAELLVLSKDEFVVGKLSAAEIVRNMDPIFHSQRCGENMAHTAASGLTPTLLKSLTQNSPLRCESFELICQHVLNLKVEDCMLSAASNEFVLESDLLEDAIHKLAMGAHQSLLVKSEERIVGLLRLSDVFRQLSQQRGISDQYSPQNNNFGY